MSGPSLVLVPPTPLHDPSPSTTASSSPDLSRLTSSEQERGSSETTIFTIYSMYGDEAAGRSSNEDHFKEAVADPSPRPRSFANGNGAGPYTSTSRRNSAYQQSTRSTTSDILYYDTSSESRSSKYVSAGEMPARASVTTNGSVHLSYLDDRPVSTRASSSVLHNSAHISSDTVRSSKYKDLPARPNNTTRVSYIPPEAVAEGSRDSAHLRQTLAPRSRTPSIQRLSPNLSANGDSPRTSIRPLPTPPRMRTPELLSPPQTPYASPQRNSTKTDTPASKTSLAPSDGEDVDAFHVRNTYAELEMSGVKGDGYEEGVERTRARLGGNRASELRAEQALDDGSEKMRELSPKELETLASLDRYGFFTVPSHDRLILLVSAPLSKRLSRAPPGPKTTPCNAKPLSSLPPVSHPAKEASRIAKWGRMLEARIRDEGGNIEAWGIKASKEPKLRERAYKGIPDRWRSAAWDLLMSRFSKTGKREMVRLGKDYRDALDKPSTYDIQIDLDVPRTISGHIMFRTRYGSGQRSLFHVLHSFSLRCEQCGYVQGMGPIAATLLCYFEPERVYASLVRIHDAYQMHTIFSPGFPGLLEAIYVQERIIEQMMPEVYSAFKNHMISTTSYATKWYITLFANSVPFQTQLRLWDVFLLEGQDLFIAVAVAIVWIYRDNITTATANFETILSLLSSFFVPENEDSLLLWIEKMLGDRKLRTTMGRWREEWRNLVATGKDGTALL